MQTIAFDTETRLIEYPDQVCPDGVCLTAYDGETEYIWHLADDIESALAMMYFYTWLRNDTLVGHNVSFDLHVLLKQWPDLWPVVWQALKDGRIHDTMLREKLYLLSITGSTHSKPCSLADLINRHLGEDISALKSGDDVWRMRYGELIETPIAEWPEEAIRYAIDDAVYTHRVYTAQESVRQPRGPGSMNSESLQVASAVALYGMTIQGMRIDQDAVAKLKERETIKFEQAVEVLKTHGLVRPDGTRDQKAVEALCEELGVTTRTASGRISTDRKTIAQITSDDPRLAAYKNYSKTIKAVSTFIPQMEFTRVHPRFNPLINTLRTSCSASDYYKHRGKKYGKKVIKQGSPVPSVNLQQIPRDAAFREAFIPEDGHLFIAADYANLELVCAAQTYYSLFGDSELRRVLNSGTNLHDATGTIIYNDYQGTTIDVDTFRDLIKAGDSNAKFCRQSAKFVNLGCPGGQSAGTIHRLANGLGIPITLAQAEKWREAARGRFPEYAKFFDHWFPNLRNGTMYLNVDGTMKRVQRYDGEIHGVWKAKATYTALANSISMQMPAALGKKRALVRIYERCTNRTSGSVLYGCHLHLDMHDEIVISVPEYKVLECEKELAECMIDGMQQILPDMRVGCDSIICRYWSKDPTSEFGGSEFYKNPKGELLHVKDEQRVEYEDTSKPSR